MDRDRAFGVIKTFDSLRGYGFIRRKKGKDVFVFFTDIQTNDQSVDPGDVVSFYVEEAPKGPRAKEVMKEGEE